MAGMPGVAASSSRKLSRAWANTWSAAQVELAAVALALKGPAHLRRTARLKTLNAAGEHLRLHLLLHQRIEGKFKG